MRRRIPTSSTRPRHQLLLSAPAVLLAAAAAESGAPPPFANAWPQRVQGGTTSIDRFLDFHRSSVPRFSYKFGFKKIEIDGFFIDKNREKLVFVRFGSGSSNGTNFQDAGPGSAPVDWGMGENLFALV